MCEGEQEASNVKAMKIIHLKKVSTENFRGNPYFIARVNLREKIFGEDEQSSKADSHHLRQPEENPEKKFIQSGNLFFIDFFTLPNGGNKKVVGPFSLFASETMDGNYFLLSSFTCEREEKIVWKIHSFVVVCLWVKH